MIKIEKQIDYWFKSAFDDLETAKILIVNKRYLQGLFFCHLVVEKAIKAIVVKNTAEIAPRSHNLLYLSELAGISYNEDDENFLGILMKYQLQGRYPDYNPLIPNEEKLNVYLFKTENLLLWLKQR
jgi:HEPN domain-containing protein